jgi:ferredoxin-NADP reductase/phenylpropionate dioxygenase-like ring-hydroxylating dioxygenase large terminal subunit
MSKGSDQFAALMAAVEHGESLPTAWYTQQAIVDEEIRHIFRRSWQYVGPLSQLKAVGDFLTGVIGEVPVVVLRNDSGLAGFVNVCRHRRHQVMKGRGNARVMTCGYHAWSYDLAGCLRRAPRSDGEPGFCVEDYPLLPLRVEALGPFVFANLDREAISVSNTYAGILEQIADSGIDLDSLELWHRNEWHARANWKTMLENYLECYHCAVAHPGFSAAIDVRPENYRLIADDFVLSQRGNVRPSALPGNGQIKLYDARGDVAQAQYHLLWPNFTISINPGFPNLSVDVWMPDGPNRAKGFSERYFGPGVSETFAEELVAFDDQVGAEDDELTDSVQQGLLSGLPECARFFTRADHLPIEFQKLVVHSLAAGARGETPQPRRGDTPTREVLVSADASRNDYAAHEVFQVKEEGDGIKSLYLRPADGKELAAHQPGQFLPIRLTMPGQPPLLRTYTISDAGHQDFYRLTIKREGAASSYLHDHAAPGFRLEAAMPRGKFILDRSSDRPVVLISGGIGITPMMAITNFLLAEGRRTAKFRPIYFVHCARNSRVHTFRDYLREVAMMHPSLKLHVCYSDPTAEDQRATVYDSRGRLTSAAILEIVDGSACDFYLCGPSSFMQDMYSGLIDRGVPSERIHYESFGSATVHKPASVRLPVPVTIVGETVGVQFARSGVAAQWSNASGTLLELAESVGLAPVFGCRSGICGSCGVRVSDGAVVYIEEPLAPCEPGVVLLCSSIPRRSPAQAGATGADLTLDL